MTEVCKWTEGNDPDAVKMVKNYSPLVVLLLVTAFCLKIRVSSLKFYARLLFSISMGIFVLTLISLAIPIAGDKELEVNAKCVNQI